MLLDLIPREPPSFPTAELGPGTAKLVSHHQAMALALVCFDTRLVLNASSFSFNLLNADIPGTGLFFTPAAILKASVEGEEEKELQGGQSHRCRWHSRTPSRQASPLQPSTELPAEAGRALALERERERRRWLSEALG